MFLLMFCSEETAFSDGKLFHETFSKQLYHEYCQLSSCGKVKNVFYFSFNSSRVQESGLFNSSL